MLLLFISRMPLGPPKNHLRSSREDHKITLYTDKMGPDFLYSHSVPVLHLTQNVLHVSPSRPFCWLSSPVRQSKFKCITCSYFFVEQFSHCFQEQEKKSAIFTALIWQKFLSNMGCFPNKHPGMPVRENWDSKEAEAGRAGVMTLLLRVTTPQKLWGYSVDRLFPPIQCEMCLTLWNELFLGRFKP